VNRCRGSAMADTNVPIPNLPEHIEETVRSIAQSTPITTRTPRCLSVPYIRSRDGVHEPPLRLRIDPRHRSRLGLSESGGSSIRRSPHRSASVLIARRCSFACIALHSLLILATQRRENQLAQRRELLILELTLLGEQKTEKVIQLFGGVPS
jgi:hypothetical protein